MDIETEVLAESSTSEPGPLLGDFEIEDDSNGDKCKRDSDVADVPATEESTDKPHTEDKNDQSSGENVEIPPKISMSYLETDSISNISKTSPTIKTEIKTIVNHRKTVKRKLEEPPQKRRGRPKKQTVTKSETSRLNPTTGLQEQELEDFLTNNVKCSYARGDVVWAKINGYSFWPAMIDEDPDIKMIFWVENFSTIPTHYHVVFFDAKNRLSRSWCKPSQIKPYGTCKVNISEKHYNAYKVRFRESVRQADEAMAMSVNDRIKRWSFLSRKRLPGTQLCHD